MFKRLAIIAAGAALSIGSLSIVPGLPIAEVSIAQASEGATLRSARKAARKKQKAKPRAPSTSVNFAQVCKRISPLKKSLLKNAYPGHINLGDPRASGFAFVCGPDCPRKFPVSVYYRDGELAAKFGYYGVWSGNGRPRAYCAAGGAPKCSASTITRNAKARGRDGKIYVSYGDGSCRSATPGVRNGSPF